jgi:hypothetical protein
MGTKTKDGPETLTIMYYSPTIESIMLIFKRDHSNILTIDLPTTRLAVEPDQAKYIIIKNDYQLIGAFYEN